MFKRFLFLAVVFLLVPMVASAQTTSTTSTDVFAGKVFSADCSAFTEGLLSNSCYEKKARGSLDCSYCEKINWFGGRVSCCVKVVNDYPREGICDNLTEVKLKEKCLSHLAAKIKSTALCNQIKDKNENFACRAEVAKQASDVKQCDKMAKAEKNYCYLKFAETGKNEKLCAKISDRSVKQFCYNKLAVVKSNEKLCPLTANKDNCYVLVAEKKKDGAICSKIKNGSMIGYCLDRVAIAKKDTSACNLIKGDYKYDCIFDVAKAKNSASMCEKVTDKVKNYQCVVHFAKAREDLSYCDYLKDQTKLGLCVAEVEQKQTARVQDMQRLADLRALQTSLELYFADNKDYPLGEKLLLGGATAVCLINGGFNGQNWTCDQTATITYFAKVPADPVNTGIYTYEYTKTVGPCYNLIARLETDYDVYKAGPIYATCDGKIYQ